jgi:hypothetical protein
MTRIDRQAQADAEAELAQSPVALDGGDEDEDDSFRLVDDDPEDQAAE